MGGSVAVSKLDLTTTARVGAGVVLNTPLSLIASDDTTLTGGAGAVAVGQTAGVGAGIDVQTVKKRTTSTVDSSTAAITRVTPGRLGDVVVRAAVHRQASVGRCGGLNGLNVDDATVASVGSSAVVTSQSNIVVSAEDMTDITGIAGGLGVGGKVGVGASAGVVIVNKDTRATVGAGAKLAAAGTGPGTRVADGGFAAGTPDPVGGTFDPNQNVYPTASGSVPANAILLFDHRFSAGAAQPVDFRAGTASDIGLVDGRTYYVIVVNGNVIRLASTAVLAQAGVCDVPLTRSAAADQKASLIPPGKGPIPYSGSLGTTSKVQAILDRCNLQPTRRSVSGVAVTAVNRDRVESYAVAGGAAGTLGAGLSAAVDVLTTKATATVGADAVVPATCWWRPGARRSTWVWAGRSASARWGWPAESTSRSSLRQLQLRSATRLR